MTHPSVSKDALRDHFRHVRRAIDPRDAALAADAARDVFLEAVAAGIMPLASSAVVAGYYPLRDELNPLPLMDALKARGYALALPVTAPRGQPLAFRRYDDMTLLQRSPFGVMEPTTGEGVIPDLVIVPVLAFDEAGQRLGYGAGHYDRTLSALRQQGHKVFAVGVAFGAQRSAELLPVGPYDVALDCIVTADGLYWPRTIVSQP